MEKQTGEPQPEHAEVERAQGVERADEVPDFEEAAADDFAARNVAMSNVFPGGATPYAGAVSGRTQPFLEPVTDEERLTDEQEAAEEGTPEAGHGG